MSEKEDLGSSFYQLFNSTPQKTQAPQQDSFYDLFSGGATSSSPTPAETPRRLQGIQNAVDEEFAVQGFIDSLAPEWQLPDPSRVSLLGIKTLSEDQLKRLDGGEALVKLTKAQAEGRYGFVEGLTDVGWHKAPYVSWVAGDAIPIREMPRVVSTLRKLGNGEMVSDQDLVYAQLYLTHRERKAQATTGGMIGDNISALGGFVAEIGISTGIGSLVAGPGPGTVTGAVVGASSATAKLAKRATFKLIDRFMRGASKEAAERLAAMLARRVGSQTMRKFGAGMAHMAVEGTRNMALNTAVTSALNLAKGEDPFMSRQAGDRYIGAQLAGKDMSMREAQMLALGDRYVEYLSESSGEALGELFLPGGSTKKMLELLNRTFPDSAALVRAKAATYAGIKAVASKLTADGDPKTLFKWLKNVGYDGYVGEMLEERFGGFARGLFGLEGDEDENRFKRAMRQAIPDRQQFMVEAVTFAVPIATTLAAAKVHRRLAGADTPQITQDIRNVLQATEELETPSVERLEDAIKTSGKGSPSVTFRDALDSLDRLRKFDQKKPEGAISKVADVLTSFAEVAVTGSFAPFVQRSNIGQVLARYGRDNLTATWNQVERVLESDADTVEAYKKLTPDERRAKVEKAARQIMTEALGVARRGLLLQDDALAKAVRQIDEAGSEEAKQQIVEELSRQMSGPNAKLAMLPVGRGRSYHDLFVRIADGHPLSKAVTNLDKAVSDVLARHGIMRERKIVDSAHDIRVDELTGVEVPLADVDALLEDPFSVKTSLLAGAVGINVGLKGSPQRLATMLGRHRELLESGAHGQVYVKDNAEHNAVESQVRLYTLADGTVVFRPAANNQGTPEQQRARMAASRKAARRLNQQISAAPNALAAMKALADSEFVLDDSPPVLVFSKHTLLANKDPKVLTDAYGQPFTNDQDAERYIREELMGVKMSDGYWVVGTGNLTDDNAVAVRAAANLAHTWEELSELRLRLLNSVRRGDSFSFDAAITDFIKAAKKLVEERINSGEDLGKWQALWALLDQGTTDGPVKLFGQLFLGYNLTEDVVGEKLLFSDQIEALRQELLQLPEMPAFVKYMGKALGILNADGSLNKAEFNRQVNPYLDAEARMVLSSGIVAASKKPAEKPAPKPAEKPAPKPAETPAPKPAEKPVSKPAETPVVEPAAKKPSKIKPVPLPEPSGESFTILPSEPEADLEPKEKPKAKPGRARRLSIRTFNKPTHSLTPVVPEQVPAYHPPHVPAWIPLRVDTFFQDDYMLAGQAAVIAAMSPVAARSIARVIHLEPPAGPPQTSQSMEEAGGLVEEEDLGLVDDPVSDAELSVMSDTNQRALKALRGVAPFAQAFEHLSGDNGYHGLYRMTHDPVILERMLKASENDEALLDWLDRVDDGETATETAFKAMLRYMNVLAEQEGDENTEGFASRHLSDLVETLRVFEQYESGELVVHPDGRIEIDVLNRSNSEARLVQLARNRLATFQGGDVLTAGRQLSEEFRAILGLGDFQGAPGSRYLHKNKLAAALRAPKSKFKTELFAFLHKLTGAPVSYFAEVAAEPSGRGREALAHMVATNLSYWFNPDASGNPNVIGGKKFNALTDAKEAGQLLYAALNDSWLSVPRKAAANKAAKSNLMRVLEHASGMADDVVEPVYKDSSLKGQAGWVQRDKYHRFLGDFFQRLGMPGAERELGSVVQLNGVKLADGSLVDFGDLEPHLLLEVVKAMADKGYLYTGVYGDKVNRRFIKVPDVSVADAARDYRKFYEAPTNTLLDQAVLVHPDVVDGWAAEHARLEALAKTGPLSVEKGEVADLRDAAFNVRRARFVSEFDRLVDGDYRFYAPKLPSSITLPKFLLNTVAEQGASLTLEQQGSAEIQRIASHLLDARTKRRSNDLTGGRDLASMERHLKDITGRDNGRVRVLVVDNPGLNASTDGMVVYRGDTFGRAYVLAMGEEFAHGEEEAPTVKFQIADTTVDVNGARVPVLDKLNAVSLSEFEGEFSYEEARQLGQLMSDADVDVVIFASSEKVPSDAAYALGFLPDDRLKLKRLKNLADVRTVNRATQLIREVEGRSFTVPVVLAGDNRPSWVRFAKQLQHIAVSARNGEALQDTISEYLAKISEDARTSDYDYLTQVAVNKLSQGDADSQALARALSTGQLSIVSPAVRGRVNLMPALLHMFEFKVPRIRGPLVMRFDAPDSGRMYTTGANGRDYALANANIDAPYAHYRTDLRVANEAEAFAAFSKLFLKALQRVNPELTPLFSELKAAKVGRAPRAVGEVIQDILAGIKWVPYDHVFQRLPATREALEGEFTSVAGERLVRAGTPWIKFTSDGNLDTATLRPNVIQQGEDGNYRLLGSMVLPDRIPADGSQSMGPVFLNHQVGDGHSNLIELDPRFVDLTGSDGDGDSPDLWLVTGVFDDSLEGIANRFISQVMDAYLTDSELAAWSERGIGRLVDEIVAPLGEEMKFGPDAQIRPVTVANSTERLLYEALVGQTGKHTIGIVAKSNTSARRLASVGGFIKDPFSLDFAFGRVTLAHSKEDAEAILDPSNTVAWNRYQMALHVSMQMAVSRAVDDGKAFIQGHMKLWGWRLALETTAILFDNSIMHPESGSDVFDYETEFETAKNRSMNITRAMASSKFLDAVDEALAPKRTQLAAARVRRAYPRSAMMDLLRGKEFLTESEAWEYSRLSRELYGNASHAYHLGMTNARKEFLRRRDAGVSVAENKALLQAEEASLNQAREQARAEVRERLDRFLIDNTQSGKWVKLFDLSESLREFGRVADAAVSAVDFRTVENFDRTRDTLVTTLRDGALGAFGITRLKNLVPAGSVVSQLEGAMPYAHPSKTPVGQALLDKFGGPAVRVDTALGSVQSQVAIMSLASLEEGGLDSMDFRFPPERLAKLRETYPDFFNLLAPSSMFENGLNLQFVYGGPHGLPLPPSVVDRAQASFDTMPRKLQLELAGLAVASFDMQTGQRHYSYTMLMGVPETSGFVRDLSAMERAVYQRFMAGDTELMAPAESILSAPTAYKGRRASAEQVFGDVFGSPLKEVPAEEAVAPEAVEAVEPAVAEPVESPGETAQADPVVEAAEAELVNESPRKSETLIPKLHKGLKVVQESAIAHPVHGGKAGARLRTDASGKPYISIDPLELLANYEARQWTSPRLQGITPLAEDAFPTAADWVRFVLEHERQHLNFPKVSRTDLAAYARNENNINHAAARSLGIVDRLYPDTQASTSAKELPQNGFVGNDHKGRWVDVRQDPVAGWYMHRDGVNDYISDGAALALFNRAREAGGSPPLTHEISSEVPQAAASQPATTAPGGKAKLDAGNLTPADIGPNTVVVVGTRKESEGHGYSGSAALAVQLGVKDPVGTGRLGEKVFGIQTVEKLGGAALPFEIVRLGFGQRAPAGVFDGHRAGRMNVTNAAPGAPGALGNPFVSNDVAGGRYTREAATRLFEQAFLKRVNEDPAYRDWVLSLRGGKVGYYKPTETSIHLQAVQKWLEAQTLGTRLDTIRQGFEQLYAEALANPSTTFLLTKVGTQRAGFTEDQIKALLPADMPRNIVTPTGWERYEPDGAPAAPATPAAPAPPATPAAPAPVSAEADVAWDKSHGPILFGTHVWPFIDPKRHPYLRKYLSSSYRADDILDDYGLESLSDFLLNIQTSVEESITENPASYNILGGGYSKQQDAGIERAIKAVSHEIEDITQQPVGQGAPAPADSEAVTPEDQDGVDVRDIRFARADTLRPTVEQAHALELIADFIRDPDARMNSLVGYAGVGKTTLLENVARYALGQGMRVQAVAPVNKAVNRIAEFFEKSNLKDVKTSTLHKLLYKMSDDIIPRKRPRDITPGTLIIVDESSQLSVDYFKDLTNALKNSQGSKVLFVGDNFQTEAIGKDAHVLDAERSPVPPTHRARLTGLMRQEAGSGLGLTVTRMRATHTPAVPTRSTEDFQLHDGVRSFEDAYKKALLENADDVAMIVATNADRLYWNKVARDTLFGAQASSKALVAGDLLMSVANSVNVNNGEQLKVLSPGKAHAEFQVKMPSSDKKGVVMVNFIRYVGARVSLGRETFEPILYMAPGLTLPSVWQVEVEQGLDNESRAALEHLGDLKLDTTTGRRSFDPRIIFVTHGFAVTAHKAQGSEWGRVFVKQSYNSGWDMARWLYTAATRAKKRVDLLAQPDPRLQQRFDLEEYRAEMEQVPIEFIERPVTHSLTRVVEEYTPAELIDRTLFGMGRRAGDPSPAWAKKRLLEDYRDEFESIVRAPTRDKAHKAIDKLVRDPRVQPPVDLYAEKVFRRWVDHKFEWTGDAWPAVDRQPGELRPTQKVLQDTPEEYVREIGEQPNYRRYKTADALVEEWLEAHIEEVVAQNPDMTGLTLLDKRIRLAEAWNKALAPFVKAPSYEVAAAALEDTNNLAGLTDLAVESMRQWAYEHLPSKFSKAQQAYFDFAGDYSPHSLDGLADPVTQAPSEATHSLVAVVSGFDDVLSPYRGGGGATLTRILVDESVQIQKELSRVDRFYKQRVVEWGLSGYIDKYKEYTFRIGPDGKPAKYKLKGRALWGNWGAEKLTEDEQKLNALIQLAAYMGLEYTTVDKDGKPKFDKVAGERLRVILPVGVEGDIHELYKLLPETVALRLHTEMQQKLKAAKKLANKERTRAQKEDPSITEDAAEALYQRTLALALGDIAIYTQENFGFGDPRAIPELFNANWVPRNMSYVVPYQVIVDAMNASKDSRGDNQLLSKLIKNGRDASRLNIETLVNESAEMLAGMEEFANSRAPWIMSKDAPYLRHRTAYAPHYFGSGYYGPEERKVRSKVLRAVNWASSKTYEKLLNPAGAPPVGKRTLADIPDFVWEALYDAEVGLLFPGAKQAREALEHGELAFMGLPKNAEYADVIAALQSKLHEIFYTNAARGEEDLTLLPGGPGDPPGPPVVDNALGLAKALQTLREGYKDREYTNRAKARFHTTFEEAFRVSGRRPSNIGALDAVHKYATDMLLATKNRIVLNQFVQVTDIENTPLVIPAPNMEAGMSAKDEVLTKEAWRMVANRLAEWFHDKVDPAQSLRANVDRMVNKYVVNNKSFTKVESPYHSIGTFYTFNRGLGKENFLDSLLAGGEAAGVLKHVVGKPWSDPWGALKAIQHVNTWMKIQALQLSVFFPLAGQEGLVAMFGHKRFSSTGGPVIPLVEWRRMIKTGHPYAMALMQQAESLGFQFSATANPLGIPTGYIEKDIDRAATFVEEHIGTTAGSSVRFVGSLAKRQTNFMFESYYNTIKLWTIHKFAEVERKKAEKAGREFDFDTAMRPYVDYINSEVGGINWNKYSWMTPTVRQFMSLGMFSVDWTLSAWNAAGGGLITAPLLKNHMTEEELKFIATRRWPQMYLYVLALVPALVQATAYAVGLAMGTVDDDDEWLIFKNEPGRRLHADLTPLLRGMPWYEGAPTGERRSYIRWGKQAYEVQRWIESPWNSLMSKSSQIARWAIEQATGTSGGAHNFPLPFKGQGLAGLLFDREGNFWGSRTGYTLKKFMPFSLMAWAQNPDAAPLQIVGPVSKGLSFYAATEAYSGLLDSWARADTYGNIYRHPYVKANLDALGWEILKAAERNGYDPAKVVSSAKGAVLRKLYANLYKGVNNNNQAEVERWARSILRVNGTLNRTLASVKNRNNMYGKPEKITDAQKEMLREAFSRP